MKLTEQLSSPDESVRLRAAQALALQETEEAAQSLAGALNDESWRVRRVAVSALAERGGRNAVIALLRALRTEHRNLGTLNSALQVLALTDLDVLTPLIEFLSDPDTDLRVYAALALGEHGDPRATPALIDALSDPDVNVRYHAIEALGKLRASEAADALVMQAVSDDFFLAFPALDALKHIGDPSVAAQIVPLLRDDLLRVPAAETLGQIGDDRVVAPLVALLNAPGAPARAIAGALAALYDRYDEQYREGAHIAGLVRDAIRPTGVQNLLDALDGARGSELRALALVLGWLEGRAVERALVRLLGHASVRKEVVDALVQHGSRMTELLISQLNAEDPETRQAAAVALGRIGDPRAVPALIRALTEDDELAIVAAGALAKIGDRSALDTLLELLGHPNPAVRQAVVTAINSVGHPELAARMRACLQDPDPCVRESAVKIAGYFGFTECADLLYERCRDVEEHVRRAAIEQIPYLDDLQVLPTLASALQEDSAGVRTAAARALAQVEDPQALSHLLVALTDEDPWVRYYAARSLGQHGAPAALDELARLAQTDPAPQVRIAAVEALGQIGGKRAVAILASLIDTANEDLARATLHTLGRIAHPDAVLPLTSALDSPSPGRRIEAIRALGERSEQEAIVALQQVAEAETDPAVVHAAIDALARVATPEAVDVLVTLSTHPTCRPACISALAQVHEAQIDRVAEGLQSPHVEVRHTVVAALARMKHPRASEALCKALEDSDVSVRVAAANALAHLGSHYAERKLLDLAQTDPDAAARQALERQIQAIRAGENAILR